MSAAAGAGARPLEAFLFDLDGTLIDSIELIRASHAHTLAAFGLPPATRAEWLAGLGRPLRDQFGALCDDPEVVAAMIRAYRAYNLERHDAMVRAYPGVADALRSLSARGGRLGVVTSKQNESAARGLARCGLEGLFEVLVGADDVRRGKPAPEPVLLALERLGVEPERAVYVGDSPHDVAAGRAAGTRTAAVLWGPLSRAELAGCAPDAWLETPADLRDLGAAAG